MDRVNDESLTTGGMIDDHFCYTDRWTRRNADQIEIAMIHSIVLDVVEIAAASLEHDRSLTNFERIQGSHMERRATFGKDGGPLDDVNQPDKPTHERRPFKMKISTAKKKQELTEIYDRSAG